MRRLAAALGLLLLAAPPAAASGLVRVAVVEWARSAELAGRGIEVSGLGACPACRARSWRTDVVRAAVAGTGIEIDGRQAPAFRLRSDSPIRLGGREYGPVVELVRNGGGLAVVVETGLEDYLAGVLLGEVGEQWPAEALRAQAVAARTYAAYHRLQNAGRPWHLLATTAHQVYAGLAAPGSPVREAVRATAGRVLRLDGELFPAFYHADSGGYTEEPHRVFTTNGLPPLTAVVCPFSAASPHARWTLDVPLADLGQALRRHGVQVGTVTSIEVTERTPSLRAAAVTVRGTQATARLRGNDFRRMVGYDTLRSTLFAVVVDAAAARFAGRGWGHGVGLCQWGARAMAEQGYTAGQILSFYYPRAVLGALEAR